MIRSFISGNMLNEKHKDKLVSTFNNKMIVVDIDGYRNASIVTGDEYHPDLVVTDRDRITVFELTIGFKTNLENNTNNKAN